MNRPLFLSNLYNSEGYKPHGYHFTSRSESMEQDTVTTLTATREARSMRKKHSGNIFRYGKDLLRNLSYTLYTERRGPGATGVTKKHQKFKFEYWVFSQKSYLNVLFCKGPYLHT